MYEKFLAGVAVYSVAKGVSKSKLKPDNVTVIAISQNVIFCTTVRRDLHVLHVDVLH